MPGLSVLDLEHRDKQPTIINLKVTATNVYSTLHSAQVNTSLKLAALIFACVISGLSDVMV